MPEGVGSVELGFFSPCRPHALGLLAVLLDAQLHLAQSCMRTYEQCVQIFFVKMCKILLVMREKKAILKC